jgi:hypothetical protein
MRTHYHCMDSFSVLYLVHEQLTMTRPQRIATFAGVMLTSMAINAFFFGKGTTATVAGPCSMVPTHPPTPTRL